MENNVNKELEQELEQIKLELESEKFKNTYSEELLEKAMTENSEWEVKVNSRDNLVKELEKKLERNEVNSQSNEELAAANVRISQLETELLNNSSAGIEEELQQSKVKINELMLANQQLREETAKSQQGIGEVMLMAKQQAATMIADAENEIKVNVEKAKQEFFDIGNKANTISEEIKASQENVNHIYKELLERIERMSEIDFDI